MLKGKKRAFTDQNLPFTENNWEKMLAFWKLGLTNLVFIVWYIFLMH